MPRVRKLREAKQVDHYMLFSNRRLSAISESDIRAYLAKGGGIPEASIYLCGVEQLEIFLKKFPDVVEIADLDPVDSPLIVSPQDLAEIVQALARHRESVQAVLDDPPVSRVYYERKNVLNNMTPEYAEAQQRRFLKETAEIQAFLAAPENTLLLQMYESVVDEFQLKIIAKRKDYQTFDSIMNYLIDLLFSRDPVLRQHGHKRLTRAILFYMYWNCDIGNQDDAETD